MSPARPTAKTLEWLGPLVVLALVWWVFSPALSAEFLFFDDDQVITGNRAFRGLDGEHLAWMLRASHFGHYQPLTWLSFALDHAFFGLDAGAFHRTSVALHALCALAFYGFARTLFGRLWPARDPTTAAVLAALLFAVHPLRAESVAWVTERRDVLSGLLLVLGLGAWLRSAPLQQQDDAPTGVPRAALGALLAALAAVGVFFASVILERSALLAFTGPGLGGIALAALALVACGALAERSVPRSARARAWYWVALLCFVLSLFSKAWGIVIPAVLLVLDVWPLRRLRGGARGLPALVAEKLPFICLSIVFAALAAWAQATQADTMKGLVEHTLSERVAQAAYGLAWYPWKTLLPTGLVAIYELPDTLPLSQPRFLVPLAAVLVVTLALLLARRRAPALLTAWVVFGIVVSPVLGFAQSGPQLVADRYSYLSCLPFALLAGSAVFVLRSRALAKAVTALLVLAVAAYGFLGQRQVRVWHDSLTLWVHVHSTRPESSMAMIMLASEHQRRAAAESDSEAARMQLERARELLEAGYALDEDPHLSSGLAAVHMSLAVLEPELADEHLARAVTLSREALELAHRTGSFTPRYRLIYGTALWNAGRAEEALEHFEWFARVQPEDVGGLLKLGRARLTLGRPVQARGPLERALELAPTQVEGWRALADVYAALGAPELERRARERLDALGG